MVLVVVMLMLMFMVRVREFNSIPRVGKGIGTG